MSSSSSRAERSPGRATARRHNRRVPSRKQRRRRDKLKRHEYEYVIETEEGEVPVERPREADVARARSRDGRAGGGEPRVVDRRGRPIEKPTLRRVLRRGLVFGPLLFLFVYIVYGDELTTEQAIFQAVLLIAFFIPFSYLVDSMVYRMMMRRAARDAGGGRRGR
jgi:hypothetical protein